jgi:nicotinamidase-related amidase
MTDDASNPRAALIVADMQQGVVQRVGDHAAELLGRLADAIDAARAAGVPVVYVVVGFRPGHPEVSPRNKMFAPIAEAGGFADGSDGVRIHPTVAPRDGDVVVVKRRVSAFSGSDLDMVLRSRGIQRLVLTGVATSGVILSTVRQASDLDYELVVLSDAVRDGDDEVHRVLLEKVFPRQADVLTVAEWADSL